MSASVGAQIRSGSIPWPFGLNAILDTDGLSQLAIDRLGELACMLARGIPSGPCHTRGIWEAARASHPHLTPPAPPLHAFVRRVEPLYMKDLPVT